MPAQATESWVPAPENAFSSRYLHALHERDEVARGAAEASSATAAGSPAAEEGCCAGATFSSAVAEPSPGVHAPSTAPESPSSAVESPSSEVDYRARWAEVCHDIPADWTMAREVTEKSGVPWSMVVGYARKFPQILPSKKAWNGRRWFPPEAAEIVMELSRTGKQRRGWKREKKPEA